MSSNGLTLDRAWSRGTKRSSPHQTWTLPATGRRSRGRGGEIAVDADRGGAAGRGPVGPTARLDGGPQRRPDPVPGQLRRGRPRRRRRRSPVRSSTAGRAPAGGMGPPTSWAAARRLTVAMSSRRPVSIASASRSTSPRRAARNRRSNASTPSCQTRTWTASASAVTSARNSEPRRSASSSTRRVVPAGIVETTGRRTTATSPRPWLSVAAIPRLTAGRPPGAGFEREARGPLRHDCQRLHDRHPEPRGQPRDVVDRLDDVRRARRARLVMGGVRHGDPPQRAQIRQEIRIVEDRGDGLPPARLADQGEIADRQPGHVEQARHLAHPLESVAVPRRAVHHEAIRAARAGPARRAR